MALSDVAIRKAKPKEKSYMMRDDRGLYLEITPRGSKLWRLRFWVNGKERKKSLGRYPGVGLKEAREERDRIKLEISKGESPFTPASGGLSFRDVAEEWHARQVVPVLAPGTTQRTRYCLERFVYPHLADEPIQGISPRTLLPILKAIDDRGHHDTAHRILHICSQIFRYGLATGTVEVDSAAALRGALTPLNHKHHPSVKDPKEIGALMRAIETMGGSAVVRIAMQILAYCFVRQGELRSAEWGEIDLDKAEWRIPAEKMKMKRLHIVPLSKQAVNALRDLYPLTGHAQLVFPSIRAWGKPISENTINAALRRMGYTKEQMTGHGFRSMASTILNENGWSPDVIERQLAHVQRNTVRAAYNHAEYLPQRREMM
ncbi:MAG: integrase [Dethiosulfovibrio peptidovorans]|nr:MAG: integrase [Dethiosulfovibrio peptidovorans]